MKENLCLISILKITQIKKKKKLRCFFKICAYTIVDDMFYSCHICYTIVDKVIKSLLDNRYL